MLRSDDRDDGELLAGQSRRLLGGVVLLAVFCVLVAGLLLAVPGLRSAADRISDAKPGWIAVAVLLELLSCAGYVVLFRLVFRPLERGLSARLSLAELAVNSVVSLSGVAGIALGAFVLRGRGFSAERIARRSVLMFVLTSAVNVLVTIVLGVLMWAGVLPGSSDPLLTLLPAAGALLLAALALGGAAWARRMLRGGAVEQEGKLALALVALEGGVREAVELIRRGDWRLVGAVGYWLFDNLALVACLAAFGPSPSVWVVSMAYLVGMMANAVPVPAGLVAVEGGLVAMLAAFGVRPAALVLGAVLVYRAIQLWVPALVGSLAFMGLRRELRESAVRAVG
jgi:uncharacterized membrane protein YbhN (UPF0104 family)